MNPEIEFAQATLAEAERDAANARTEIEAQIRALLPDWAAQVGRAYVDAWSDAAVAAGPAVIGAFKTELGEWATSYQSVVLERPDLYHRGGSVTASELESRARSYNSAMVSDVMRIAREHGLPVGTPYSDRDQIEIAGTVYPIPVPSDVSEWVAAENAVLDARRSVQELQENQTKTRAAAMWDEA